MLPELQNLKAGPIAYPVEKTGVLMNKSASKRFSISLSFPGEYRNFVEKVADHLAKSVSKNRVLYDKYWEAEFARLDLDIYLPNLYRNESELIVIFLCPEYSEKRWCKLEWRFIKQLIATIDKDRIMLVSFGEPGDLSDLGILPGDGYLNIDSRQPKEIAVLMLERYALNKGAFIHQLQQIDPLPSETSNNSAISQKTESIRIVDTVHSEINHRKETQKTRRSFWEQASWIAGVLSAVITLIVWLSSFSHQHRNISTETDVNIKKPEIQKTVPGAADAKVEGRWSCEGVIQDLEPAFEAAKSISFSPTKDDAMLAIARKALCIHNYSVFEKSVNEISFSPTKDQAYSDAVDFALENRQLDIAHKYVGLIAFSLTQDNARKHIVLKTTQK